MSFMNAVKETLNDEYNYSTTENGAVGYRTTGKELLDMNFAVASMRNMSPDQIWDKFERAFYADQMLAMRWLFYARDARQGVGERRLFREIMKKMAIGHPDMVKCVIPLVPEYGRFDDLLELLTINSVKGTVIQFIDKQLALDYVDMMAGRQISLIAKWLPSSNASSDRTRKYAKIIYETLNLSEKRYRKILSQLRAYLNVVETKMTAKKWDEIDYEKVPSRANLIYNDAFLRNDEERRREYLRKLEKGEAKINSGVLFPHDILHRLVHWDDEVALEAMWKALPDMVYGCGNTIVVADGSGSMYTEVDPKSGVTALEVANALAIYFAEHSSGEFRDKYITFSERPQFVDFSNCKSLRDKWNVAEQHSECANTNIEKVFDLILKTAVKNHMSQEDIPQNVLIISDMEFDSCATIGMGYYVTRHKQRLFDEIKLRYEDAGYKLPRLVFWNVNFRTGTIPIKENDLGVALVSGFSVNICNMVMSGKTDPYECLIETLMNERYDAVEEALRKYLTNDK